MRLVVGLGNPGSRYARNRHNVGFRVVERLGRDLPWSRKFEGELTLGDWDGEKVGLLKPLTYMNASGDAVSAAAHFYKLPGDEVLVIHDEIDLPFGRLQLKRGGGNAGHNGLRSIADRLGGPDFVRLRVGVGRPPAGWDPANYVLSDFTADEERELDEIAPHAADAARSWATQGLAKAMNAFNQRPKQGGEATKA